LGEEAELGRGEAEAVVVEMVEMVARSMGGARTEASAMAAEGPAEAVGEVEALEVEAMVVEALEAAEQEVAAVAAVEMALVHLVEEAKLGREEAEAVVVGIGEVLLAQVGALMAEEVRAAEVA
jgi:hypothetical protein